MLDGSAGGLSIGSVFCVWLMPQKNDVDEQKGSADMTVFLSKVLSFFHGLYAAGLLPVRPSTALSMADGCGSQATATRYAQQRALDDCAGSIATVLRNASLICKEVSPLLASAAAQLVVRLPKYVGVVVPESKKKKTDAPVVLPGGWWGAGWDLTHQLLAVSSAGLASVSSAPKAMPELLRSSLGSASTLDPAFSTVASIGKTSSPSLSWDPLVSARRLDDLFEDLRMPLPADVVAPSIPLPAILTQYHLDNLLIPHESQVTLLPEELHSAFPGLTALGESTPQVHAVLDELIAVELRTFYGDAVATCILRCAIDACATYLPELQRAHTTGAWNVAIAPLLWVMNLSRGHLRELLSSVLQFSALCESTCLWV